MNAKLIYHIYFSELYNVKFILTHPTQIREKICNDQSVYCHTLHKHISRSLGGVIVIAVPNYLCANTCLLTLRVRKMFGTKVIKIVLYVIQATFKKNSGYL